MKQLFVICCLWCAAIPLLGQSASFQHTLLKEINLLREHPVYYANTVILPYARYYKGRQLKLPGNRNISTKEGVRALQESVKVLKKMTALPPMQYSSDLGAAACLHVADQSRSGRTGHIGGNGSSVADRIGTFVIWCGQIAENIFYGDLSVREVIIFLLIDDGVRDRGHRKNLLNPNLKYMGAAYAYHPVYSKVVVMDFAGDVKGKH